MRGRPLALALAVASLAAPLALAAGLAGCAARVHTDPDPFDVDDPRAAAAPAPRAVSWDMRPEAAAGPGRRDGTIPRADLNAVLDAGPGVFLHGFEVAAVLDRGRFTGWRLVQWMPGERRFAGLDLAPGDVLIAINGRPLSRPDQLEALWDSLRAANELVCDLTRGDARFQLRFAITPPIAATATPESPAPPPAPAIVTVPYDADDPRAAPPAPPPPAHGKRTPRRRAK